MPLTNSTGGVPPRKHKLNRSNIEQEENEQMTEKRLAGQVQQFPKMLHKAGGLWKQCDTEAALEADLAKGWYVDIRDVPGIEQETPTQVSHMTVAQAEAFIAEYANDPAKLVEIEQDERTHGNRASVIALIDAAKDAVGSVPAPKKSAAKKSAAKKK